MEGIKLLLYHGESFAPVTVAEAVILKQDNVTKRLDQALKEMLIVENEEFSIVSKPEGTKILHKNTITSNTTKSLQKITYDKNGHITEALEFPITINGNNLDALNLGEDFTLDNNHIKLKWGNGTTA